ncbi:MAG: DUF368 domain-containing protein [Gammaproteobacteria bacterium]|nr:DUF368 domain-containing protein [Gammaproteobacteria bacterium]MCY4209638.1 DUF368 domain-containing protein [Gammaproteobacteria bacterium]MCY4339676.1 DUF368 domain-containing protein [Gammaproteobacteria bacterium]
MRAKQRLTLVAKGFCIGTADIIPGVSGGTMAFMLGIYREFIAAIKSFDLAMLAALIRLELRQALARPHFGFILPLLLGIIAALLFFTRVVSLPQLLQDYPEQVYGLFFGLVGGSIVALLRETGVPGGRDCLLLALGALGSYGVFNMVPVQTPDAGWFIFIAGALAICAMLLPGLSGSFVLLLLNKYTYVFSAIGYFKLSVLLPFVAGALTGLVLFSRLLSWVLERYYRAAVVFISGLLLASLTVLWPFRARTVPVDPALIDASPAISTALVSGALMLAGFALVLALSRRVAVH